MPSTANQPNPPHRPHQLHSSRAPAVASHARATRTQVSPHPNVHRMRKNKNTYLSFNLRIPPSRLAPEHRIYLFERDARRLRDKVRRPDVRRTACHRKYSKRCTSPSLLAADTLMFSGPKNSRWRPLHQCGRYQADYNCKSKSAKEGRGGWGDSQLLTQFDAVESATPLLRTESGNTSLGRTQPMGP